MRLSRRATWPIAIVGALLLGSLWAWSQVTMQEAEAAMTEDIQPKRDYSDSGYDLRAIQPQEKAKLLEKLTLEQLQITQRSGTEAPFCGTLLDNKQDGIYTCVVCGLPLFSSQHKFTSGTGWPSFFTAFDPLHVAELEDRSHGMERTEIRCARCEAHLGHVFSDGPQPTGLRYCLNSASLEFLAKGAEVPERSRPIPTEKAYFAGGCFWGVEHKLAQVPGVLDAASGYQNGSMQNPSYKQVCSGDTGHAESVRVVYDPTRITYRKLVETFFGIHDPTTLNRQGPDMGSQYRSAIFTVGEDQDRIAREVIAELTDSGRFKGRKIVTLVEPTGTFYRAEEYHQDYHARRGTSCGI